MKSGVLQIAALCVCPPAILATSVATIPTVKRAVHHATRPAPAKQKIVQTRAKLVKSASIAAGVPCDAMPGVPAAALLAYNAPLPTVSGEGFVDPAPPVNQTPRPIPVGTPFIPGASAGVPEPGTWMLMISGFGLVGVGLRWRRARAATAPTTLVPVAFDAPVRRRRRSRAKRAGGLSSLMAGLGIGETATGSASMATIAAKTMMCVCPTVAIVGSTMTIPPIRTAVYKATSVPAPFVPTVVATVLKPPCDPTLRSAEADEPPSRIIDGDAASPQVATALLASTTPEPTGTQ
ncbi:MAG: PEPxxWA-CTERM sorting domain-containing protein [Sphingomonadales bacterium]